MKIFDMNVFRVVENILTHTLLQYENIWHFTNVILKKNLLKYIL